jgi:hypothetical protein
MRILRLQVMRLGGKGQALTITARSRDPDFDLHGQLRRLRCLRDLRVSCVVLIRLQLHIAAQHLVLTACIGLALWGAMLRMWLHEHSFARLSNDLHGGAWLRPSA